MQLKIQFFIQSNLTDRQCLHYPDKSEIDNQPNFDLRYILLYIFMSLSFKIHDCHDFWIQYFYKNNLMYRQIWCSDIITKLSIQK